MLRQTSILPAVLALLCSAALWGMSWYPYRLLAQEGLSGLWALVVTNALATAICAAVFRARLHGLRLDGELILIGALSGITNTAFILGTLQGEVLRVTLLLYLSPLWTLFLARLVLKERITAAGLAIVALSLAGAVIMLSGGTAGSGAAPISVADGLGLFGGMSYAAYNVAVRHASAVDNAHKTLVSSAGSLLVAMAALPFAAETLAAAPQAQAFASGAVWFLLVLSGVLLVAVVFLMQYGLVRIEATRAIVILVSELVFAAGSAWWLAGEEPGLREWIGALLIGAASLLSARVQPAD